MYKMILVVLILVMALSNVGMFIVDVYATFFQYGERVQELNVLVRS